MSHLLSIRINCDNLNILILLYINIKLLIYHKLSLIPSENNVTEQQLSMSKCWACDSSTMRCLFHLLLIHLFIILFVDVNVI